MSLMNSYGRSMRNICCLKDIKWAIFHLIYIIVSKNRLTKQINLAKKMYLINKLTINRKNMITTWRTINSMLKRSGKNPIPSTIIDGDFERSEPLSIANSFLDYFSTVPHQYCKFNTCLQYRPSVLYASVKP